MSAEGAWWLSPVPSSVPVPWRGRPSRRLCVLSTSDPSRCAVVETWAGAGAAARSSCPAVSFPLCGPRGLGGLASPGLRAEGASLGPCRWGSCRARLPLESSVMLLRPSACLCMLSAERDVRPQARCPGDPASGCTPTHLAPWPWKHGVWPRRHYSEWGSQKAHGGLVPSPPPSCSLSL